MNPSREQLRVNDITQAPLRRVVLVGGTGFIGHATMQAIQSRFPRCMIVVTGTSLTRPKHLDVKIAYTRLSLSEPSSYESLFCAHDIVFHLACSSDPRTSELNMDEDRKVNIAGSIELFRSAVSAQVDKFIFISSGGTVYGNLAKPATENDPCTPEHAHGKMKREIELALQHEASDTTVDLFILRLSNVYGREASVYRQQGVIDVFIARVSSGLAIQVWGDGNQIRDYIHVHDVVSFFLIIAFETCQPGVYNVSSNSGATIRDIITLMEKHSGMRVTVEWHPSRHFDIAAIVLDNKKALTLGWSPRISLDSGVQMLCNRHTK